MTRMGQRSQTAARWFQFSATCSAPNFRSFALAAFAAARLRLRHVSVEQHVLNTLIHFELSVLRRVHVEPLLISSARHRHTVA
jgi:hypothetical protein